MADNEFIQFLKKWKQVGIQVMETIEFIHFSTSFMIEK